MQAADRQTNR